MSIFLFSGPSDRATPTVSSPPGSPRSSDPARERSTEAIFGRGEVVADRFRVERRLGYGGFAEVYRALDLSLGERVALKVLRPDIARRPEAASWLRREVLCARAVTHGHVCRIFDVFEHFEAVGENADEARLVIAMEWIEGPTLAEHLRAHGPFVPADALVLARQLAAALDAAHAAGVLHLDLKSANVILAGVGPAGSRGETCPRAVITDFGLARALRPGSLETEPPSTPRGTPGYMAPEQRCGGELAPATDVFAFGCVLHEMLTGTLPRGARAPGRPAELLPAAWRRVIELCRRPDPAERPASATAALAPVDGSPWRRVTGSVPAIAAGLLALTLGLAALASRVDTETAPRLVMDRSAADPDAWLSPWNASMPVDPGAREALVEARDAIAERAAVRAVERAEAAVALAGDACLPRLVLSRAWSLRGRETRAAEIALAAESACAEAAPATRLLAETRRFEVRREWRRAIDGYTTLATLFPGDPEPTFDLVRVLLAAAELDDARAALNRLESHLDGQSDPPLDAVTRIRIDLWRARLGCDAGDAGAVLTAARRALDQASAVDQPLLCAHALDRLGRASRQLAHRGLGLDSLRQAREIFEAAGDDFAATAVRRREAETRSHLGATREEIERELARAVDFYAAVGHPEEHADALADLAGEALRRRDGAAGEPLLERALEIYRRLGDLEGVAEIVADLAVLAHGRGSLVEAEALYEEALELRRRAGRKISLAFLFNNLGILYAERGEVRRALDALVEAQREAREGGFRVMELLAGTNLARIALQRGRFAEAATILDARVAEIEGLEEDLEPTRIGATLGLSRGDLALVTGLLDEADEIYRRHLAQAEAGGDALSVAHSHSRLAALANRRGSPTIALDHAARALAFFAPGTDEGHRFRARDEEIRALVDLGRLDEARRALEAITPNPADESLERRAIHRLASARVLHAEGRSDEAARRLRELLAELPIDWRVPLRRRAESLLAEIDLAKGAA